MSRSFALPALTFILLCGIALSSPPGCSREGGNRTLEAAIVPGADLVGSLDYRKAAAAPAFVEVSRAGEKRTPTAPSGWEERVVALERATGLSRDDVTALRFSADLDTLRLDGKGWQETEVDALLAVAFDRAVTSVQLRGGLDVLTESMPQRAWVAESTFEDRPGFTVSPSVPGEPALHAALARDGKGVFLSFNARSIGSALRREEGTPAELTPAMSKALQFLEEGSQLRTTIVLSNPMRRELDRLVVDAEKKAHKNPGMSFLLGFMAPFRGLAALSLDTHFDDGISLGLTADLGGEGQALQAAALLQSTVVPMVKARMVRQRGGKLSDFDTKVSVVSRGQELKVTLTLDAADVAALNL